MSEQGDKVRLLSQLRIDREHRDPQGVATATPPRWLGGVLLLLVILLGSAWAYFHFAQRPLEVHVASAQATGPSAASSSVLDATGYVTAQRRATVSAQITGTLTAVLIEEGDHVKEGQVLARLEDTSQRAAVSQAQAELHSAQALLTQYETQLAQSRRDEKRAEDLLDRRLVSPQAVEQAKTLVDTQIAQVEGQRRQIEVAAANVRSAQVQLEYCTVHAPFTGVVIAKAAQVGEIVSPFSAGGGFTRTGIGTLVDMDSLEVEVDVNEAYINRVQPQQRVESILNAYPEWRIPSHVIAIIPTADRAKATVKVRIGLDQKDARIVPDMGVRVSFLEAQQPAKHDAPSAAVIVPPGAVVKDAGHDSLFVVKDNTARRRTVTTGAALTTGQQVLSGLAAGEVVIVNPRAILTDGARVSVVQ
ncbi:MAG: efflux RND transporter periplasmic adaptor subunit [Sinobacteraceae bacterium]|nr:efflux RND transporter periplasmic adaptor subunit [Nevskiaceae bacterium]